MSTKLDGKFSCDDKGIFNTVSGERLPADEPIFLLRGRDHHASRALLYYLHLCAEDCNALHCEGITQSIRKFADFRQQHPERMKQPGITRHLKLEEDQP